MNAQVDIEAGLRRLEHELTRDPDIDAVYMFGSYARKRANPLSDIDIGILLNENVPPGSYFARRLQHMAQCAGVLRTDRVEVVLLNEVSAHLAHEVISCRTILFERNPEHRVRFEVDTIKKYLDFKPFMRVRVKYMKDQLLSGRFFD